MKLKINWHRPDLICLSIIPVWIILGLIAGNKELEIQLHDTYYVIAYIRLVHYSIIVFGIYGLIYWLIIRSKRRLIKRLTVAHLVLSVIGFLIFLLIAAITGALGTGSGLTMDYENSYTFIIAMLVGIICILLGLALFSINLAIAIILSLTKNQ